MSERSVEGGFSLVSLILAMLICLALVVIYLREGASLDPRGGTPGGALRAARSQAEKFEEGQRRRLDEMRKVLPREPSR